ncbi:tetratricopeptide repeat-containing protein [Massilia agri]|uniref:Tetratricopeptide repeat-containing protein n=1 Tax=Massilia agri TaxID=1886785 RepID=A0ABT2AEQ7_9BURK|nr:tetratricopeptide repeat-containing protein [Massilia agri]MCS0594726.1 tetratricopeptide repeat-containing protein [Massilia agri]
MDKNSDTFPSLDKPGAVTTLYAYEGGPARNGLLAAMALQLAGDPAQGPVLVIDWDLESPSLHQYLGAPGHDAGAVEGIEPEPPGLVDYFSALRDALARRPARGASTGPVAESLADSVLDTVDWRAHVARADGRHPLYLMRAGRFDEDYAERAARLDWVALFDACPALLRRFAARMARHFRHVLVSSRAGRSAAVSACTTLLADRLVGLFTPAPGSLEGLEGVVRRAIEYRCSHEDEQRPLLVYPVACPAFGAGSDPGQRWRRGDPALGMAGYQPRLETLLREAYGNSRLRLGSWFDEVQLPACDAVAVRRAGAGYHALARPAASLLCWFAQGYYPWQPLSEVRLRMAIAHAGREGGASPALAACFARLGALCQEEGRDSEAEALLRDSLAMRHDALGEDHLEVRAGLAALANLHAASGRLHEARREFEALAQRCARSLGAEDPETLVARSRLACVLGRLGEGERALALHEQVVAGCERLFGDLHAATLGSLEDLALTLREQHENERARLLFERVLDGRRRLQGSEHEDTLLCGQRLARLLGEMGDLGNARRLLESVLRARERQDGLDAAATLQVREALADVYAAQGDVAAVRRIQDQLPWAREEVAVLRQGSAPAGGEPVPRDGPAGAMAPPESDSHPASSSLQHQLAQLQSLIDSDSPREARALADSLRPSVLSSSVAHPLRKRGAEMIKRVYQQDGDKDALLSWAEDVVASLEGALFQAERASSSMLR